MCGNEADAADATQEALIAVARGLPRFDGRAAVSTWVYRVATNACLDELRRRSRRPVLSPFDDDGRREPGSTRRSGATSIPDPTAAVDARLDVDAALVHLGPELRAAVVLRDLCGLDYAEIAEVLSIPGGTVRSRIARGRSRLADVLGGNQHHLDDRPTTQP